MRNNLIIPILILSLFMFTFCGQEDYDRIMEVGLTGKGIIQKVEDTNVTINENPQVRLYLTVYSKDREPFDAVIKMVVSRVNVPRKGDWVAVKYDPVDNQKIVWIESEDMTPQIEKELNNL
jgi:hypothetical protein